MASRKLPNYLRRYRKLLGLSQPEVGFLLGGLTGACVSTHERFLKQPGIEGIFGYEVLFAALRRAVIYGSVLASFNVEAFSLERLRTLTSEEIKARYEVFRAMSAFDATE